MFRVLFYVSVLNLKSKNDEEVNYKFNIDLFIYTIVFARE